MPCEQSEARRSAAAMEVPVSEDLFFFESGCDIGEDPFAIPPVLPEALKQGDHHHALGEDILEAASDAAHKKQKRQSLHTFDPKTKKYYCPFPGCGKEFSTSGHLARHHRIHTGEKNHACSLCGMRFSRQDNCNQHLKSHLRPPRPSKRAPSMASTESLHDDQVPRDQTRPNVLAHSNSYAGSLATLSEADASSVHEVPITTTSDIHSHNGQVFSDVASLTDISTLAEFHSPSLNDKNVYCDDFASTLLPDSFFYLSKATLEEGTPSLGYDSSATEESAAFDAFNATDFISQEDFFHWSAGVMFPDAVETEAAETETIDPTFTTEDI